jgi:hypothetical protein
MQQDFQIVTFYVQFYRGENDYIKFASGKMISIRRSEYSFRIFNS